MSDKKNEGTAILSKIEKNTEKTVKILLKSPINENNRGIKGRAVVPLIAKQVKESAPYQGNRKSIKASPVKTTSNEPKQATPSKVSVKERSEREAIIEIPKVTQRLPKKDEKAPPVNSSNKVPSNNPEQSAFSNVPTKAEQANETVKEDQRQGKLVKLVSSGVGKALGGTKKAIVGLPDKIADKDGELKDSMGVAAGGPFFTALKEVVEKKDDPIIQWLAQKGGLLGKLFKRKKREKNKLPEGYKLNKNGKLVDNKGKFVKKEKAEEILKLSGIEATLIETSKKDEKRHKEALKEDQAQNTSMVRAINGIEAGSGSGLGGVKLPKGMLSTLGKLGKGFTKLLGPVMAVYSLFNLFSDANDDKGISEITGKDKKNITAEDRTAYASAGFAESVTLGLITKENVYKHRKGVKKGDEIQKKQGTWTRNGYVSPKKTKVKDKKPISLRQNLKSKKAKEESKNHPASSLQATIKKDDSIQKEMLKEARLNNKKIDQLNKKLDQRASDEHPYTVSNRYLTQVISG